jgi:hypothetical protein
MSDIEKQIVTPVSCDDIVSRYLAREIQSLILKKTGLGSRIIDLVNQFLDVSTV